MNLADQLPPFDDWYEAIHDGEPMTVTISVMTHTEAVLYAVEASKDYMNWALREIASGAIEFDAQALKEARTRRAASVAACRAAAQDEARKSWWSRVVSKRVD